MDPDHARHLVRPDLESNCLERLLVNDTISIYICVSFQEYSWIQDFETDVPFLESQHLSAGLGRFNRVSYLSDQSPKKSWTWEIHFNPIPLTLGTQISLRICIGVSFKEYSWIQDFEADFHEKVSLWMLN